MHNYVNLNVAFASFHEICMPSGALTLILHRTFSGARSVQITGS